MKKYVLKKWFEKVCEIIACLTLMLIVCTIDSEWTTTYLQFLIVNCLLFALSSHLLIKYKRQEEDNEEDF